MTVPSERTHAVLYAEQFLIRLVSREIKRIPKEVREEARRILRHFPTRYDLIDLARRAPDRWGRPED